MATVTGFTAEHMQEIEDGTIVDGYVNGSGHLILIRHDEVEIDAGYVVGPSGPEGPGANLRALADLSVAVWELEAKSIAQDNGLQDWHGEAFITGNNRVESRTIDANGNFRLGIYRNEDRDQGYVSIDDIDPLEFYHGTTAMPGGNYSIQKVAIHPSGNWIAVYSTGSDVRIYPCAAGDGVPSGAHVNSKTLPGTPRSLVWSNDGKVLVVGHATTPFMTAFTFNVGTGVLTIFAANPATLPVSDVEFVKFTPNDNYLIAVTSTSPFINAWAIDTDAGTWGAKSANPATLPGNGINGMAVGPIDSAIFIAYGSVRAYPFNQGTGAFGVHADAPGSPANATAVVVSPDGTKVIVGRSTTPGIMGWNWNAGAWSARWADPAQGLYSDGLTPNNYIASGNSLAIDPAYGDWVAYGRELGVAGPYIGGYLLGANAFGTQLPYITGPGGSSPVVALAKRYGTVIVNATNGYALLGDKAGGGSKQLTGQLVTTTKVLDAAVDQIYILDDAVLDANVTRQYDISVDGGTNWNNNVTIGQVIGVSPGSQLKIRLTMTRTALTQEGRIYWFLAWGG